MTFVKYISILLACLFLFYFIGFIIKSFIKNKSNDFGSNCFGNLFHGLIITVVVYAILITVFKTIFSGFIVLYFVYIIYNRDSSYKFNKPKFQLRHTVYLLIPIIFYTYRYFFIFSTDTGVPLVVESDNHFNCNLAMFLNHTGKESIVWDLFNYKEIGISPYHYFESWFIALISTIFNENYWLILQLVCIPILQTILVIGTISFIDLFSKSLFVKLLSISLIFFSGILFNGIEQIHLGSWFPFMWSKNHWYNAFNDPWVLRLLVGYILYVYSLIELFNKRYFNAIIFISVVPLFSVVIGMPVIMALTSIIILAYSFKRIMLKKALLFLFPIAFALSFFYFLYSKYSYKSPLPIPSVYETIISLLNLASIRSSLIFILEDMINLFGRYTFLITLLAFLIYKNRIKVRDTRFYIISLFSGFVLFFGFLMRGILKDYMGAWEFSYYSFMNFASPAIILSIIYLLSISKKNIRKYSLVIMYIYIFYCIVISLSTDIKYQKGFGKKYSFKYYQNVKSNIQNSSFPIIGLFENKNELAHNFNPFIQEQAFYLNVACNKFYFVSMSFGDIDTNNLKDKPYYQFHKSFISSSPFYKFVVMNKNSKKTIDVLQYEFIRKNKIKYLSVTALGSLPNIFISHIEKDYKDPISGERFIVLYWH
ncbi:MAG: hypothetical protein A2X12_09180 [Bacteroidetes bacterium GWE2_29_8]|nr:MAG: hypothetical protein A2X12_09180 [Bacteroidetes bacterium GWE2_29_8]OFY20548.1 MAG: hypothetical protein A2X02_06240 [Bacteroidetes bacterium GWF2_29_10]